MLPLLFLSSNLENCVHLKYFGNVYCVMTNHIGDQDKRANHKPQTNYCCCLQFSYLMSDWLLDNIILPKYIRYSQLFEFDINPLTLRNDQFISSPYNFNTL